MGFTDVLSGRSLVWSRTSACHYVDWSMYRIHLSKLYGKQYQSLLYSYGKRYYSLLTDIPKISALPVSTRSNVLKSLVSLSKFLGIHTEFTTAFKNHGIKWASGDSFKAFLNGINNHNDTVLDWVRSSGKVLRDHERLFIKFCLLTGLRKTEAVNSFNLIIELSKQSRLSEYYDQERHLLTHFKYDKIFLRNSKNAFISIVSPDLIKQISDSNTVSYSMIRKRLSKNNLKLRIKECRSYYATFLRNKGILSETIDLTQGRIGKSVFARHYLKTDLKMVSEQILKLIEELQASI